MDDLGFIDLRNEEFHEQKVFEQPGLRLPRIVILSIIRMYNGRGRVVRLKVSLAVIIVSISCITYHNLHPLTFLRG